MDAAPPPVARSKDFLSVLDVSHAELTYVLDLAATMKAERSVEHHASRAMPLSGRHVALLFEKPSFRTRSTFEIAVHELGGNTLHLPAEFAEGTREPIHDVARNLERWVAALVIRTYAQDKAAAFAAAAPGLHVINALSDEQHPCQALADMLTLREHCGPLPGRTLAYVGDGNNVAASLAHASVMLGVTIHLASPAGYALAPRVVDEARAVARAGAEVRLFSNPHEAVAGADAVYTDVWTSMGQERESIKRRRVFAEYQVNAALMGKAAPDAIFMHCLPAHRDEEVTSDIFESARSVVFDQAENRLHTQKALLATLLT